MMQKQWCNFPLIGCRPHSKRSYGKPVVAKGSWHVFRMHELAEVGKQTPSWLQSECKGLQQRALNGLNDIYFFSRPASSALKCSRGLPAESVFSSRTVKARSAWAGMTALSWRWGWKENKGMRNKTGQHAAQHPWGEMWDKNSQGHLTGVSVGVQGPPGCGRRLVRDSLVVLILFERDWRKRPGQKYPSEAQTHHKTRLKCSTRASACPYWLTELWRVSHCNWGCPDPSPCPDRAAAWTPSPWPRPSCPADTPTDCCLLLEVHGTQRWDIGEHLDRGSANSLTDGYTIRSKIWWRGWSSSRWMKRFGDLPQRRKQISHVLNMLL